MTNCSFIFIVSSYFHRSEFGWISVVILCFELFVTEEQKDCWVHRYFMLIRRNSRVTKEGSYRWSWRSFDSFGLHWGTYSCYEIEDIHQIHWVERMGQLSPLRYSFVYFRREMMSWDYLRDRQEKVRDRQVQWRQVAGKQVPEKLKKLSFIPWVTIFFNSLLILIITVTLKSFGKSLHFPLG